MPAVKSEPKDGDESPESGVMRCVFDRMLKEELGRPVDFELPDSFRKWKPTEYISIKRNVYFTKRRIEDDGIFCSCSPSGSSSVCCGDCHCEMLFSACSSSCKCGDSCLNKPFQRRPLKKLKVIKTEKCGLGLAADEDIRKGDFVIEYVGEETVENETPGDTNFYLCEVNHGMVIDATFKGNRSRFINHGCEPNTEMQKWRIDGETRIGIFAIRNIRKGEELTYDYQFVQFGADQDCHCGALSCKKKLGNKPSKTNLSFSDSNCKDLPNEGSHAVNTYPSFLHQREACSQNCTGEVVRIWCSRYKRYFGGIISGFDSYSREHTVIFEDGRVEFLDMSQEDWEFL